MPKENKANVSEFAKNSTPLISKIKNMFDIVGNSNIDNEISTNEINSLKILECRRKLYMELLTNSNKSCISAINAYVKNRYVSLFSNSSEFSVLKKNFVAHDMSCGIYSEVDAIIKYHDSTFVLSIYPFSNEDYADISNKLFSRKYIVDSMTKIWLVEMPDAIIIYANRDSDPLEYKMVHVIKNNQMIKTIYDMSKEIYNSFVLNCIPSKPYTSGSNAECKACTFYNSCWK